MNLQHIQRFQYIQVQGLIVFNLQRRNQFRKDLTGFEKLLQIKSYEGPISHIYSLLMSLEVISDSSHVHWEKDVGQEISIQAKHNFITIMDYK